MYFHMWKISFLFKTIYDLQLLLKNMPTIHTLFHSDNLVRLTFCFSNLLEGWLKNAKETKLPLCNVIKIQTRNNLEEQKGHI